MPQLRYPRRRTISTRVDRQPASLNGVARTRCRNDRQIRFERKMRRLFKHMVSKIPGVDFGAHPRVTIFRQLAGLMFTSIGQLTNPPSRKQRG